MILVKSWLVHRTQLEIATLPTPTRETIKILFLGIIFVEELETASLVIYLEIFYFMNCIRL